MSFHVSFLYVSLYKIKKKLYIKIICKMSKKIIFNLI